MLNIIYNNLIFIFNEKPKQNSLVNEKINYKTKNEFKKDLIISFN